MRFKIKKYRFGDDRYKKRFAFIPTILDGEEDYYNYTYVWFEFFYKRQKRQVYSWENKGNISVEEYEKIMKGNQND